MSKHRRRSAAAPATPRGCTNFKLRQLTRRVSQHYDRIVGAAGLKTTQYSLLSHIARLGPARPGDLPRAMAMDASTLTRNLQPLVANGWAEIGPGADGRSRLVAATAPAAPSAPRRSANGSGRSSRSTSGSATARVAELHALLDDCLAACPNRAGETRCLIPCPPPRALARRSPSAWSCSPPAASSR